MIFSLIISIETGMLPSNSHSIPAAILPSIEAMTGLLEEYKDKVAYANSASPAPTGSEGTALLLRPPRLFMNSLEKLGLVLKKLDLEIAVPEANLSYLNPLHSKVTLFSSSPLPSPPFFLFFVFPSFSASLNFLAQNSIFLT